jgi:uncharacterized membrane protein YfcA
MRNLVREQKLTWDAVGITASAVCVVHCVVTPIALIFLPALSRFLPGNESFRRWLVLAVFSIGMISFASGYNRHRRKLLLVPLVAGMALIATGAFLISNDVQETIVTLLGSALVISAHVMNRSFCRRCEACDHGDSEHCGK